MALIPRAE